MAALFEFDDSRKFDVIPMGRIAIDFNPLSDEYYQSSDKVTVFEKFIGGSPANISVGLARLGVKTGFIGKVSDDQFGTYAINYLKNEGIDVSHITRSKNKENLGLAFTEILSPTESSLLMYRHNVADLALMPEDVDEEYIKSTKILLISGTALAASPSREAVLKALQLAKKNGTVVVFDIDYRPHTWKSTDEITAYYSIVATHSDMILGSREEFNLTERFIFSEPVDDLASAKHWFDCGAKAVIIKHGKEGSRAYFSNGEKYLVKPFPVKFLKGFGGGDGYASAFLCVLLEGGSLKDALSAASASAAMLVAAKACSDSMPSREELRNFERESIEKYGEMVTMI
ncbi:MAG: 5-dehydro-2-deoxygluconokinase [Anaerovoracaceae bacterium]|jgi:5-dehydro-2-deoxygluconokinase